MKKGLFFCLLMVAEMVMVPSLSFASPALFNYQGTLNDAAGKPVTGSKKMVFRIYPAVNTVLANALWTSAEMTVNVSSGAFSVTLGENPAFPANLFSEDNRYIGVSVEGTELLPRQRMASVPYAIQAGMIKMPYKARAYRNVRQDFSHQVLTKVQFNQESYDPNNNFDNVSNFRYTVPVSGYYLVNVNLTYRQDYPGKLGWGNIHLRINGNTIVVVSADTCVGCNAYFLQPVLSDIFYFNQGDFIELFGMVSTSDGSSAYIYTTGDSNSFTVHLMSQ